MILEKETETKMSTMLIMASAACNKREFVLLLYATKESRFNKEADNEVSFLIFKTSGCLKLVSLLLMQGLCISTNYSKTRNHMEPYCRCKHYNYWSLSCEKFFVLVTFDHCSTPTFGKCRAFRTNIDQTCNVWLNIIRLQILSHLHVNIINTARSSRLNRK